MNCMRAVIVVGYVKVANAGIVEKFDALLDSTGTQVCLEATAVNLIAWRWQCTACTYFSHLIDIAATFRKEEPKTKFFKMFALQVRFQPKYFRQIVRADFHG